MIGDKPNKTFTFIKKFDLKSILLIVLSLALILSFIFRPSKVIEKHESEINALHLANDVLAHKNDSLFALNKKIDDEMRQLTILIIENQDKLKESNKKIKILQNERSKILAHVNSLDGDAVASEFSNYLKKRSDSHNK